MESLNKLKTQITELIDKVEDKDLIQSLSELSTSIDLIEADTTALENDQRDLLRDYKDLIKHTSFKIEEAPARASAEPPRLEDFLANIKTN